MENLLADSSVVAESPTDAAPGSLAVIQHGSIEAIIITRDAGVILPAILVAFGENRNRGGRTDRTEADSMIGLIEIAI
jgi:hypothetical protein